MIIYIVFCSKDCDKIKEEIRFANFLLYKFNFGLWIGRLEHLVLT